MRFKLFKDWGDLKAFVDQLSLKPIGYTLTASFICASTLTIVGGQVIYYLSQEGGSKSRSSNESSVVKTTHQSLTPSDINQILERNLFNSEGKLGDSEEVEDEGGTAPQDEIPKSNLGLELMGVIFGGDPEVGLAMIKDTRKNRVRSYLVGDEINRGVNLKEVYEERVVILNKGRMEYLPLERQEIVRVHRGKKKPSRSSSQPGLAPLASGPVAESFKEPGFEREGTDITLSQQYKENLLGPQLQKVLQDAKAEPNLVGGQLNGFKLTRIREGSIYQKAGFQSGDVVYEINGIPLRDAAGAIRLLQSLRNENEIEARVGRGGQQFNMLVRIQN